MPRWLGVDYGEKRVGLAVSDPDAFLATSKDVCLVTGPRDALEQVSRAFAAYGAQAVVVGLPLNMDGSRGPAALKAEQFARDLAERLKMPVRLWDERLTTKAAHDVLIEGGTRRERRREVVDKLAAQLMLQNFLDAQGGALPPGSP